MVYYALTLLLAIAFTAPSFAGSLRDEMAKVAKDVKTFVADKGSTISVGPLTGPPIMAGAESGMREALALELKKINVTIDETGTGPVTLKGEYKFANQPVPDTTGSGEGHNRKVINLALSFIDSLGNSLGNVDYQPVLDQEADVAQLAGVPVALPGGDASVKERDQALTQALEKPKAEVQAGTRIVANEVYAIELIVEGKPLAPTVQNGLAFAPIGRGQKYAVKLINDSDLDAAVKLTIDGLSVFAFSKLRQTDGPLKGEPRYSVYLVPKRTTLLVPGWHVDNENSDAFLVTEFAKSAAAALKSKSPVGTITAAFSAAWPEGEPPPPDEPNKRKNSGGDATGRGPQTPFVLKEAVRTVGLVRATANVRYLKNPKN